VGPARRAALAALPAAFLALSLDRLAPDPPPSPRAVADWRGAAAELPARDAGRFGRPGDPLNLLFVGTPEAIRAALAAAGWTEIPLTLRASLAAGCLELFEGRTLASFPPMNDYRVGGRRQDMNWAKVVTPIAARHHFRLWRSGARDARGRELWWGSGNYDRSVRWRDLSHVPDPDMDAERGFILSTLAGSARVESAALAAAPQVPRAGVNDKGYAFADDGNVAVVVFAP